MREELDANIEIIGEAASTQIGFDHNMDAAQRRAWSMRREVAYV